MVRPTILAVVMGLILFATARISFIDGLLRPVTIDGPSMAPALCGAHYAVTCGECGAGFACDAEHVPVSGLAECFNCGFDKIPLESFPIRPPDRVLLDRWPLLFRAPKRHEVVACRDPEGIFTVKRIAALPGERLRIVAGQLFRGQQPIRKSSAERKRMRLLAGVRRAGLALKKSLDDVTDYDAYNQGELKRPLNRVRDAWFTCDGNAQGAAACRIWRDIYYLDPDGLSRPWQAAAPLGDDEFALLGDNQPVSVDSRQWEPHGVKRRDISGLVYRPFWAARR